MTKYTGKRKRPGWNITTEQRAECILFINNFHCKNKIDERNLKILKLAFIEDKNCTEISELNDPIIICHSNRNKGMPLSGSSVWSIIKFYFPNLKKNQIHRNNIEKRIELMKKRREKCIKKIERCAFCGTSNNLELHHMIPLFMGGTNDNENLVYLCTDCHKIVTKYTNEIKKDKLRQIEHGETSKI